jgi:retinol dehydrogenase-14
MTIENVTLLINVVNCYTHFLICLELLPLLRSTAALRGSPTRLIFVGSGTQNTTTLMKKPVSASSTVIDHFDDEKNFDKMNRYADSKLVVHAYVRRLATLAPSEVIVNNLCPGPVQTGLDKNLPLYLKAVIRLVRKFTARDIAEGARTIIYASAVVGAETNGKFLRNNVIDP